jgi:hypothetical protein
MPPTNGWDLYREALLLGLRIPPGQDFQASSDALPLPLNTETTLVPAVPLPRALATIFRFGDTLPAWAPYYQPTAATIFGTYSAFVAALAEKARPIRQARELLRETERQLAAGSGALVMEIETDAGQRTVPRFDPSPLGVIGYSGWLELAILAAGQKAPPEIDVTVTARELAARPQAAGRPERPFLQASPLLGTELVDADIEALRLTIQAVTTVALGRGGWFLADLLRLYPDADDFKPGTPFAEQPIWGPQGLFNLIPVLLYVGFRPTVTLTLAANTVERLSRARALSGAEPKGTRLGAGPFEVRFATEAPVFDPQARTLTLSSFSLQGQLLALTADRPNYP